jgi:hypothetical protein
MISLNQHMRPKYVRNVVKRKFRDRSESSGRLQYQIYQVEYHVQNEVSRPIEHATQWLDHVLQREIWRELGII